MGISTVVLASAGTGKTRRLVEVYLELLGQGVGPLRIAAMTFTEKAAAEMRDRIRAAIFSTMSALAPEEQGRWMRMVSLLPVAPISTIHGFCAFLLREHGPVMDMDPAFTILDEQRSLDLARESAVETIRREIRAGNEDVERLYGDFGLMALAETLVSAGYWLSGTGRDAAWLMACVHKQRSAAADLERELAGSIEAYGGDFETIGSFADQIEASRARHPLRERKDPEGLLPLIGQIAGVDVAERLSRLTLRHVELFRRKKRSVNALDFDDLLLGARDLLKDHPRVRLHCHERFDAVLVDEFQDTDEVQAEIIRLLTSCSSGSGPGDGSFLSEEDRGRAIRLVVVGDPKQSIYRFRRARVAVFFQMIEEIAGNGGRLEHLQDNYRSAGPLVEFSNRLSQSMMDGLGRHRIGDAGLDLSYRVRFGADDQLISKSDAPFLGIRYLAAETGANAAAGRATEAEALARLIEGWKSDGTIQRWKEVAILLRGMPNVEVYRQALEGCGIPVYVVQGARFYQKSEVSDLIALLELILRPEDDLLRATVLTSSLQGGTFDWLLCRPESGSGISTSEFRKWDSRIPIFSIIQPWIERRDQATAAEILQDVIRKTNFDVVMMAQKDGLQRVANIGKLIEVTRELARQGTTALDEVVRHLRARVLDTRVREPEAQIVGQDDDVVRILTVHQAKGLEFDIVMLPDLAARSGRNNDGLTFFSDRWGILAGAAYGLHRKTLPHSLMLKAKQQEDDEQYEEEKRLLYVAVTRARKMLVFGEGFSSQPGPWLRWVRDFLDTVQPGAVQSARQGTATAIPVRGRHEFPVEILPASKLAGLKRWMPSPGSSSRTTGCAPAGDATSGNPLQRLPMHGGGPNRRVRVRQLDMTPSDLSALDGCFRYFHWTRILGRFEPAGERGGDNSGMRLGALAHQLLETGVPVTADVLAAHGLPDLALVLESSEWRELAGQCPERELPFIMHIPVEGRDCWIRGRMDAVAPGDPPRVIDYKYASWHEEGQLNYEIQMTAYSLALMKSLGTRRAGAELWYLKSPMKILRREYTFRDAQDRLSALLRKYINAIEQDDWPPAARSYCDRTGCGFRTECWPPGEVSDRDSRFEVFS